MDSYEKPEIKDLGSLQDLTLLFKDSTGVDGIVLQPGNIPLGPVS
jgi:hypothetical protein